MFYFNRAKVFVLGAVLACGPLHAQVGLAGVWADRITEDSYERSGGPPLGDYQGIPLNDAGRMKADSHDHSEWSLPEFQCRPHPGPYQWRALGPIRVTEEIDPVSRELAAYHVRSEEHTSELQSPDHLVCRLLLEKKNKTTPPTTHYHTTQR